jgi:hypothetical protein
MPSAQRAEIRKRDDRRRSPRTIDATPRERRSFLGAEGKPLIVPSACRSPEHNRAHGGAIRSKRLAGATFDLAMTNHSRNVGYAPVHAHPGPIRTDQVRVRIARGFRRDDRTGTVEGTRRRSGTVDSRDGAAVVSSGC